MIRTQIYLPQDLYQTLRLRALKENKPAAAVIRELIADGLKRDAAKSNAADVLLRMADRAVHNLPPDMSVNIDEYLYNE